MLTLTVENMLPILVLTNVNVFWCPADFLKIWNDFVITETCWVITSLHLVLVRNLDIR